MLNELDHELERRGHRFVRYADDMMIFCRSRKAAERTLRHLKPYVEGKAVSETQRTEDEDLPHDGSEPEVLWFGFCLKPRHQKSTTASEVQGQCRQRLKAITSRSRGRSLEAYRKELKAFVCGWVNYFAESSMAIFVRSTDEWLRRRIRQIYWKQWKKVRQSLRRSGNWA